jgi:hypothetical protein
MSITWAPLQQRGSIYQSGITNIENVLKITCSAHRGGTWYYSASVKPIGLGDDFIVGGLAESLQDVQKSILVVAKSMIDQAEQALSRTHTSFGSSVWDDFDITRYGISTRPIPDLLYLRVQRYGGLWQPVVCTVFDEYTHTVSDDLEVAKQETERQAGLYLQKAKKVLENLAAQTCNLSLDQLYRNALQDALQAVLKTTDKVLSDNDLVIILQSACAYQKVPLFFPEDHDRAMQLIVDLRAAV